MNKKQECSFLNIQCNCVHYFILYYTKEKGLILSKKVLKTHDFLKNYNLKESRIYFVPDQIKILNNHLNDEVSRSLIAELNTGLYIAINVTDEKESIINHLNFKEKRRLTSCSFKEAFNEIISSFLQDNTKTHPVELTFFSNSIWLPESYESWVELNKNLTNVAPVPIDKIPEKILFLDKDESYQTEFTVLGSKTFSLVFLPHIEEKVKLNYTLMKRSEELDEVLKTINTFFEVPSLSQLTGADQDWLDKLITNNTLKMRLRHIVNQNTTISIAKELLQKGNLEPLGRLFNQAQDSLNHDFELNCEPIDSFIQDIVHSGLSLGSLCTLNREISGSIHLIETKNMNEFKKFLKNHKIGQTDSELIILL